MPIRRVILTLGVIGLVMGLMYLYPVALATFAGGTAGTFRVASWPEAAPECAGRPTAVTERAAWLARGWIALRPGLWEEHFGSQTSPYHAVVLLADCRPGDAAYPRESSALLALLDGLPDDAAGLNGCLAQEGPLQGMTPLHLAIMADRPDLVGWLLSAGAEPETPACAGGPAAGQDAVEFVRRLAEGGVANPEVARLLSERR